MATATPVTRRDMGRVRHPRLAGRHVPDDCTAVVAHSLLNALAVVRVSIDTLSDMDATLSAPERLSLHDDATGALDRVGEALLFLARGLPVVIPRREAAG